MVIPSFEQVSGSSYTSRIPSSLQSVYLASNRGTNVVEAPPKRMANRDFPALFSKLKDKPQFKPSKPKTKFVFATKPQPKKPSPKAIKPQDYLDSILEQQGYQKSTVRSLQTSLVQNPTELQKASYAQHIQRLVKDGNTEAFVATIKAGLSPNPCNKFGESLLHLVCRYGNHELLQRMIWDLGTSVLVCDDYGRTALHDACWASEPAFDVVDLLVETIGDASFFLVEDRRGCLPLAYVKQDSWAEWVDYLDQRRDAFFPPVRSGSRRASPLMCRALQEPPYSVEMPNPKNALSIETAQMVASGKISPSTARYHDNADDESEAEDDDTYLSSDSESSCSSSFDESEFDSDLDLSSLDGMDVDDAELEAEMSELLKKLG